MYRLRSASIALAGLAAIAGATDKKGYMFYADDRATQEQQAALKDIAHAMWQKAVAANGVTDESKVPDGYGCGSALLRLR